MAKYLHVGTQPLVVDPGAREQSILPGATFEADLDPAQEAFWRKSGAIEKIEPQPPAPAHE